MRLAVAVLTVVAASAWMPGAAEAQRWRATDDIPRYEDFLKEALPGAETFRWVNRGTPHYRGYKTGPNGEDELVGLGFFTVDFAKNVRGYKGEIWMLVGMDPGGTLINVSMVYHNEPFGYFSVDLEKFVAQFRGKSVMAPLTVGKDIDAVSQATITNDSAVRAIRESARLMAREFIAERSSEP